MRARNLKPSYFKNEDLAKCPPLARLLFAGIWCLADRDGRLEDRPPRIKAEVLPYDDGDAEKLLALLARGGFIHRYQADGRRVIQITSWAKHANPHPNEKSEGLPPPPEIGEFVKLHEESGNLIPSSSSLNPSSPFPLPSPDPLAGEAGGGKGGKKAGPKPTKAAEGFDAFWAAYPRKEAKAKAVEAWDRIRPDPAIRERISAALSRQRVSEQWSRDGGRYIPLPATYLNQHRWEDEPSSLADSAAPNAQRDESARLRVLQERAEAMRCQKGRTGTSAGATSTPPSSASPPTRT